LSDLNLALAALGVVLLLLVIALAGIVIQDRQDLQALRDQLEDPTR
jgi:hypothetical protein